MRQGRGALLRCAVALLVCLAAVACAPGRASTPDPADRSRAAADARPNLVMFLVDDMRADELRFMPTTRRLLAERGVRFTDAISPHPVCCPARTSLITGQYAQNHGVRHNFGKYGAYPAFTDRDNTIATWLQDAVYRTGEIGKFLNRYPSRRPPEPGWDRWEPLLSPATLYDRFHFYGQRHLTEGYVTDAIERRTNAAVRSFSDSGSPFYLSVNHTAPHARQSEESHRPPLVAREYRHHPIPRSRLRFLRNPALDDSPGDLPGRLHAAPVRRHLLIREERARIRSLLSVDDAVASLVRTLRRTGELDDTWIVFASDNGYQLGEHRQRYKNQLLRESLDVPLLIAGPGVVHPGRTDRRIASLVDVPATLLDLAGVEAGRTDGVSLLPALHDRPLRWRDTTLVQTGRNGSRGEQPGWRLRGVQTRRYLFATDVATDPHGDYLFDRRRDPHELHNVAYDPHYTRVVAALQRRVDALQDCAGEDCNRRWGPLPEPRR